VPELGAEHAHRLAEGLTGTREALLDRPVFEIARSLGRVGARFLKDGDPLRVQALAHLPPSAGVSHAMAKTVLDGMARDWEEGRLRSLLASDFGDPGALDGFVERGRSRQRALGARLAFHVASGSVPGVAATSLLRSLLVKTPVFLKPGRGDVVLPTLVLRGLEEEDPALARSAVVVYWPGGADASIPVEDALLSRADLVVAYGGGASVRDLRRRMEPTARLVSYHHRVSFVLLGRDALVGEELERCAARTAWAVALFDQRGCVSPHAVIVEDPGRAEAFAEALARALESLDSELPPGRLSEAEASALQQLRGTAELEAAAGEGVVVRSGGATPWTVVLDPRAPLRPSCLHRFVRVLAVTDLTQARERVAGLSPYLQSAAVAGVEGERMESLAEELARVGVLRLTTLEGMPFPPAWWRHDGAGPLEALVRWVELDGL
jgi:hypothetical protein